MHSQEILFYRLDPIEKIYDGWKLFSFSIEVFHSSVILYVYNMI